MEVRKIMTAEPEVVTIEADDSVGLAVKRLMEHGIGALPVVERGRVPVGLVAERDIARTVHEDSRWVEDMTVQRIMQRPPPLCTLDDDIQAVMARMTRDRLRHLIVCDDEGRLAGVVSVGDLLKQRLGELEVEAAVLRDYVAGQRSRA